jgi:Phage gp6-like head-tail connector protein
VTATVFFADPSNEIATLTNVFKVSGVPTDATTAVVTVTDPTGATSTPSVTHVSTGTYSATVACTLSGVWLYKWVGTGTASDVTEGTFTVTTIDQTVYATVEEVKSRLGITDTTDDFELTLAVQAASRSIDEICGRYFWRGTDTRTYIPESMWRQSTDDLVSVTTLKIDRDGDGVYEETWTSGTDYALEVAPGRYNVSSKGEQWPYTGFRVINSGKYLPFVWPWRHLDAIQITGVFGWPAVPLAVKQAALIQAADLFKLKDAPFGVAGVSDLGIMRVGSNQQVYSLLGRYMNGQRVGV